MSLPHIILGILKAEGALSGYDLKQHMDGSTRHFWYSDLSQIYRALDSLKENGWVTGTEDEDNNRNRITYTITPDGEHEFVVWLAADFDRLNVRHPALAKLFFGHFASPSRLRQQMTEYRQFHTQLYEKYQGIERRVESERTNHPEHVDFWLMTLEFGKRNAQAALEWCDDVLDKLSEIEKRDT